MLKSLGIMLLDHIIVSNNEAYSMAQHGDIVYRVRTLYSRLNYNVESIRSLENKEFLTFFACFFPRDML